MAAYRKRASAKRGSSDSGADEAYDEAGNMWGDMSAHLAQCKESSSRDSGASNIRVAVRVRPPNARELAGETGGGVCISVEPDDAQVIVDTSPPKKYNFDVAFDQDTTQLDVFETVGIDLVACASIGYNSTLFTYGQTASGKTHSVMGPKGDPGLIPRIVHLLFRVHEDLKDNFNLGVEDDIATINILVEASYMEIYNEKVYDLLTDGRSEEGLKIREDKQLGVHVQGLSKLVVEDLGSVEACIKTGTHNRSVASTKFNSESSRSHAIFELHTHVKETGKAGSSEKKKKKAAPGASVGSSSKAAGGKFSSSSKAASSGSSASSSNKQAGGRAVKVTQSKVVIIDLAGSERSAKLGSKGTALKEGNSINKSLTVLGRVIKKLVEKQAHADRPVVVPYRESNLTAYLRESLGGNSRTTVLAACSPVRSNIEESLSTLRYASECKAIKTKAKKNNVLSPEAVAQELERLQKIREMLTSSMAKSPTSSGSSSKQAEAAAADPGAQGTLDDVIAHLNDLLEEKRLLEEGGFASHIEAGAEKRRTTFAAANHRGGLGGEGAALGGGLPTYPLLSVLNKDEMLSNQVLIPLRDLPFTVGSFKGVSFRLTGIGVLPEHCVFEERFKKPAPATANAAGTPNAEGGEEEGEGGGERCLALVPLGIADVLVNGARVDAFEAAGQGVALKHLDRIVLGPFRVTCLFLARPLTEEESRTWNFDACFKEVRKAPP